MAQDRLIISGATFGVMYFEGEYKTALEFAQKVSVVVCNYNQKDMLHEAAYIIAEPRRFAKD